MCLPNIIEAKIKNTALTIATLPPTNAPLKPFTKIGRIIIIGITAKS